MYRKAHLPWWAGGGECVGEECGVDNGAGLEIIHVKEKKLPHY